MQLTKLSLFSGILGDDLASERAGIKTICCVENNPFCQRVIRKHYPDMPIIGDIHDVTKAKVKEVSGYERVDIISGGDPCQPRSYAGKRRGKEDDRDLWKDMLRTVQEFKPTWVVNENPPGRLTMDYHEVLSDLESCGYETRAFLIPACAVNANHLRERLFIIAHSNSPRVERRRIRSNIKTTRSGGACRSQDLFNQRQFTEGYSDKSESELIRADDGTPYWMDRVNSIGNACMPQQVYPIYRAIVEVERITNE